MQFIDSLAKAFRVTPFDIIFFFLAFAGVFILFYFVSLRKIYEVAFGAVVWLWVYILLKVLLLWNEPMWTSGGLLPFGLSVFIISIAVYFVLILAIIFPLHWWLVISETTNPVLYTLQFVILAWLLIISIFSIIIYMIEQAYVFQVGTIFVWIRDWSVYLQSVRVSYIFKFVMSHQNIIVPLGVLLMVYKIFLSNLISAIVLSIIYNLSRVWFYKKNEDSSYRVEFHEVGGSWNPEWEW